MYKKDAQVTSGDDNVSSKLDLNKVCFSVLSQNTLLGIYGAVKHGLNVVNSKSKSVYERVKIQNLSRKRSHISATESESEESELFHFLLISLMTPSLMICETRLSQSQAETK